MKFSIKHRWTEEVIFDAEIKCASDASEDVKLGLAVKVAVKARANLADANLAGAYLAGAYLARANLAGATLTDAYLAGAYLAGAKGIAPERVTPLLMLIEQPGKIRAYKLVNKDGHGIHRDGLAYKVGTPLKVNDADTDPAVHCGAGINVTTLDWCLREWRPSYRILIVEFEAADIACIPTGTDGIFRLWRCDVVAEKAIDPVGLGLVKPPAETEAEPSNKAV